MGSYAILTAFGHDQPGIVAAITSGLFQLGCNIEDTCMTQLRGEFTMMRWFVCHHPFPQTVLWSI